MNGEKRDKTGAALFIIFAFALFLLLLLIGSVKDEVKKLNLPPASNDSSQEVPTKEWPEWDGKG